MSSSPRQTHHSALPLSSPCQVRRQYLRRPRQFVVEWKKIVRVLTYGRCMQSVSSKTPSTWKPAASATRAKPAAVHVAHVFAVSPISLLTGHRATHVQPQPSEPILRWTSNPFCQLGLSAKLRLAALHDRTKYPMNCRHILSPIHRTPYPAKPRRAAVHPIDEASLRQAQGLRSTSTGAQIL